VTALAAVAICNWRDLTHPEGGGSEVYVEQVAAGLAAQGRAVTVLCARVAGQPDDEVRDGIHYRRRGGRYTVYLHAAWALLSRKVTADVVIDVQNGLPWLSTLASRRPVVVLVHHVHREQWPIAVGRWRGRIGWQVESRVAPWLYRKSSYVAVSDTTKQELTDLGVAAGRISVVRNGTPSLPPATAARSAQPRIAVLGRLVPHKRVELVLQAAARLLGEWPTLQVDVVGDGWWREHLLAEAERLRLDDHVTFHGYADEQRKSDLLASAWVHAVPSVKEGWALTVMEAGSRQTPTIAFANAGGLSESVRDGVTGVLVDGDLEDFAAVLGDLLADQPRRAGLGGAAAVWASQFTWAAAAARWARVLDRATGAPLTLPMQRLPSAEPVSTITAR
jgi:glycosyltransferase involved in cell wall biosynthesis